MPDRKACIIGCGAIMPAHAENLLKLPGVKLAAVADIIGERAAAAAGRYGCRAYEDWRKMLLEEKPDAVHICTPHYLHAPMAVFALEHGINVLSEKPVAMTAEEAGAIIAARDASHKTAAVVFQNRLNGGTVAARQCIRSGEYGKMLGMKAIVTWHRSADYYRTSGWRGKFATEGGGVLINQSIHTLDLMRYLGGEVKGVRAHVDTFVLRDVIEVEDTADAVLQFESGARGIFFATTGYVADSPVEIEIVLEKAALTLRGEEAFLTRGGRTEEISPRPEGEPLFKVCWGRSHGKLIELFYRGLGESDPFVTLEDARETQKIIDAIRLASKMEDSVPIQPSH